MKVLTIWPFAVLLLFTVGCMTPKRANYIVPAHCMRIDIKSFTKPCEQRTNGTLVCDRVVVKASCIAPRADALR